MLGENSGFGGLPAIRGAGSARRSAALAIIVSAFFCARILLLYSANMTPRQIGLWLFYVAGFGFATVGTWCLSRTAAIAGLVLYLLMQHPDMGGLGLVSFIFVVLGYLSSIRATVLFRRLPKEAGAADAASA